MRVLKLKKTVLVGVAAFATFESVPVLAQIASDGSLPARNKFDAVEILAKSLSDSELRKRSLIGKQIYGREELDRFGDSNMADVLSNLPGVRIVNGAPALSGLDPKYTKVLFNGDPAPAGVQMDQLNPALIERIEITRGQSASQSAQSIGGTINFIFKDAPRTQQETVRYGVQYQNERLTPNLTYTYGGKSGDWSYNLPVTVSELLQTFQLNTEKQIVGADGTVSRGYQARHWRYNLAQVSFSPRISYTVNDDEKITSQSYFQIAQRFLKHRYEKTIFSGDPQLDNDFDSRTVFRIARTDIGWTKNFGDGGRVEAKLGASGARNDACTRHSVEDVVLTWRCQEEGSGGYRLTGNYQRLLAEKHALTVGFEIDRQRESQWINEAYQGVPSNPLTMGKTFVGLVDTNAVYVEDEWEVSKSLALNLGLRAENMTLGSEVPQEVLAVGAVRGPLTNAMTIVNPIVHFRYKPADDGKQTFRGSITRGYKAPEISAVGLIPELSYRDTSITNSAVAPDNVGSIGLKPELATGVNLAFETGFGKAGVFSLGGFYRDIENIIMNTTTLQTVYWSPVKRWVTQPVNFSHGSSYGLEFELRGGAVDLLPEAFVPKQPLNLRLNLNVYGSRVDAIPGPNNRLPQQSPWSATLGLDYKVSDALGIGASVYLTPDYERQGVDPHDTFRQHQLRWINAFAQYKVDAKSSLRVGLNNLFPSANSNDVYTSNSSLRSVRSGRTGLTITMETKL